MHIETAKLLALGEDDPDDQAQNYDENNTYNIDSWQRIVDYDMLKDKMMQLRNDAFFETKLSEYRSNYKEVLLSQEEYFKLFSIKMDVFVK